MKNDFVIRTMKRDEIDIMVDWAAGEGWNPGLYDADAFYAADNNGFLAGFINDEPAAVISVVKYGAGFGFLGFYIVKPEYRGMGYGLKIWNAGMEYLKDRNVGLDGVTAQQDNYKKSGFKLAYRNIRYEGVTGRAQTDLTGLTEVSKINIEDVLTYDRKFFPEDRAGFLRLWFNQPESRSYALMKNGEISALGMARACRNGYKVGPLYASDPEKAEIMFNALISNVPEGCAIFLDTPEPNSAAVQLAEKYNMTKVFETARMYTGPFPNININNIFGVTTFELG